jgi:hypothetical protein
MKTIQITTKVCGKLRVGVGACLQLFFKAVVHQGKPLRSLRLGPQRGPLSVVVSRIAAPCACLLAAGVAHALSFYSVRSVLGERHMILCLEVVFVPILSI